jgi:thiol-disulfide isomerase/thioredoxin
MQRGSSPFRKNTAVPGALTQTRFKGMSIRRLVPTVLLGTALLVAASGCGASTDEGVTSAGDTASDPAVAEASKSPSESEPSASQEQEADVPSTLDFKADTVDGEAFDGASLAGKPAVLWFWAPWCPTCRGQIDGVSALSDKYGDKISFVGVGSLDKAPAIAGFAADVPTGMAHLLDPDGAVWRHFGVVEQSTYVVLDSAGKVVSEGYLSDAKLAELVGDLAA